MLLAAAMTIKLHLSDVLEHPDAIPEVAEHCTCTQTTIFTKDAHRAQ
jgi:hypothetical protein